jgi:uncharacterized protein YndB with AHSA1/START domain
MKNTLKVTAPGDREIVVTRVLDAPRSLVWDAMNQPELLKRWLLGPPGWTMVECENDLRVGGAFRHVWHGPDGTRMAMHGVYREVVPPERVVRTETFDMGCDAQGGEQLATATLTEHGGKTTLTIRLLFPSKEARDGARASGMEHGMAAGYDRLDEVLASVVRS